MRRMGRFLIIVFCCFHVVAVAAMTYPGELETEAIGRVRNTVRQYTDRYLNWTSQWQYWNLFAPNPTNWITEHRIEMFDGREWKTVQLIGGHTLSVWHRSDELKIQQRIEEDDGQTMRERYLSDACARAGVPPGTLSRLILRTNTLTRDEPIPRLGGDWYEKVSATVFCPPLESL